MLMKRVSIFPASIDLSIYSTSLLSRDSKIEIQCTHANCHPNNAFLQGLRRVMLKCSAWQFYLQSLRKNFESGVWGMGRLGYTKHKYNLVPP